MNEKIDVLSYTYATLTGTTLVQINGDETATKKLFAKGSNRLFRISGGYLGHSIEEYDGIGWTTIPVETL